MHLEKTLDKIRPKNYILPLHKKSGSLQLFILLLLMTTLMIMVVSIQISVLKTTSNWRTLIENEASIEVPTTSQDGEHNSIASINKTVDRIVDLLNNSADIYDVNIMNKDEIGKLLSPWLNAESDFLEDFSLPVIINFKVKDASYERYKLLSEKIKKINPRTQIQSHKNWLSKFLKFISGIHMLSALLILITSIATIFVISSSLRARIAIFKDEISLLHLMGAKDSFLLKQFTLYVLSLLVPALLVGYLLGTLTMASVSSVFLNHQDMLFPNFALKTTQYVQLAFVPLALFVLGLITATYTALKEIKKMP